MSIQTHDEDAFSFIDPDPATQANSRAEKVFAAAQSLLWWNKEERNLNSITDRKAFAISQSRVIWAQLHKNSLGPVLWLLFLTLISPQILGVGGVQRSHSVAI